MAISLAPRFPTINGLHPNAKRILAGLLGLALIGVVAIAIMYMQNRRPLTEQLPGLPAIVNGEQPVFATGLYGSADAPLVAPLGVALSPDGNRIYVTESGGDRAVQVFDRSGNPVGTLAPPDSAPGGRFPLYVAVDASGTVYVSDRIRATIDRYSPEGEYVGMWTTDGEAPASPMALTFDAEGNLYVTDLLDGNHRVLVYGPAGDLKLSFGTQGSDPGQFLFPNGVAVDRQGRIFVSDSNNGRVQVFDRTGHLLDTIGRGGAGSLSIPRGVAVDPLNRLFIVDTIGQSVEVWDVSAEPPHRLYGVGNEGNGNGQLDHPNGVALDSTGRVYVTDRLNNRVQVWSFQI